MNLEQVMQQQHFVVVGDTVQEGKFARRIKEGLLSSGYTVAAVGKELASINEVPFDIDVLDLCIHPAKGLALLQQSDKSYRTVVVQPGAGSEEIFAYLREQAIPYLENCLLIGMREYPRNK